jgi:hypothetical protein
VNSGFAKLALETVTAPQSVIEWLQSLQLSRSVLWHTMALIIILNAVLFGITNLLVPPGEMMPVIFNSPLLFGVLTGTGFVFTVYAVFYIGRGFGGSATFDTVMVSLIWLQSLRLTVQVGLSVIMLVSPVFSALLAFGASLAGFWILVNFINNFQKFNNIFTALVVLIVAGLLVVIGLVCVLSLLGPENLGVTSYV